MALEGKGDAEASNGGSKGTAGIATGGDKSDKGSGIQALGTKGDVLDYGAPPGVTVVQLPGMDPLKSDAYRVTGLLRTTLCKFNIAGKCLRGAQSNAID